MCAHVLSRDGRRSHPSSFCPINHRGVYAARTLQGSVEFDDKHLIIDGHKIRLFHEMDPANIKWCVFCYAWGPPCVCGPCGSSRRTDRTGRHTRTYHHHPTPPSP